MLLYSKKITVDFDGDITSFRKIFFDLLIHDLSLKKIRTSIINPEHIRFKRAKFTSNNYYEELFFFLKKGEVKVASNQQKLEILYTNELNQLLFSSLFFGLFLGGAISVFNDFPFIKNSIIIILLVASFYFIGYFIFKTILNNIVKRNINIATKKSKK